jgi:hypothetical protein
MYGSLLSTGCVLLPPSVYLASALCANGGTSWETSTYMTEIEMGGEHQEDDRPDDGGRKHL